MNKQKIILINGRFMMQKITGVQRYAYEVISAMSKIENKLFKLIVAVPDCTGLKKTFDFEIICDNSLLPPIIWQQIRLPLLRKKINADLLWSPCNIGPVFSRNHVISMHDVKVFVGPEWFTPMFRIYYKIIFPILGRTATKTLTISNFSKKELLKHCIVTEEKIKVLPEGVNLTNFYPGKSKTFSFPYVLAVSSRDPCKNMARLIDAWMHLPENVRQHRKLVIAGNGSPSFSHDGIKNMPNNVHFTGYINDDNLRSLYSGADAFIFPSLYEGFGLPPLEAMACGCPVIASNTASIPEVCGDAARFIDPYDIQSIADGIQDILINNEFKKELIRKGLERAKLFSWEKSAKEHLKVFKTILNNGF